MVSRVPVDPGTAKFELTLIVVDEPTGLELALEYNTALFAATTIECLAQHYQVLLQPSSKTPNNPSNNYHSSPHDERIQHSGAERPQEPGKPPRLEHRKPSGRPNRLCRSKLGSGTADRRHLAPSTSPRIGRHGRQFFSARRAQPARGQAGRGVGILVRREGLDRQIVSISTIAGQLGSSTAHPSWSSSSLIDTSRSSGPDVDHFAGTRGSGRFLSKPSCITYRQIGELLVLTSRTPSRRTPEIPSRTWPRIASL